MNDEVTFTDTNGFAWTVYEVPGSQIVFNDELVESTRAHLAFAAATGASTLLKRLEDYPEDWRDLSPADLEELCARAGPMPTPEGGSESDETRRWVDEITT